MFENLEINNDVKIDELYDNKTWIHGNTKNNIIFTVFIITISSEQLKYSLNAINKFDTQYSFIVNCIYNISPTSKAYNEMRVRCKTKYFIQNDEDMELYCNALSIIHNSIHNNNNKNKNNELIFVHTFKLIDDILGIGNPPIIDCLKVYSQDIMQNYPISTDVISSVDTIWHTKILQDGFITNNTNIIIGFHGNHRSNFDLLLRYCKILKSLINPNIKTNSSHKCKFIKGLFKEQEVDILLKKILFCFKSIKTIDYAILNIIIDLINSYIPKNALNTYNITNRIFINPIFEKELIECNKTNIILINNECLMSLIAICCISSNSYEYSADKYPYDIYNYFK